MKEIKEIKEMINYAVGHVTGGIWNYGAKGAEISAGFAVVGTGISYYLGGWDMMVKALVVFMVADFVCGFLAALKSGKVNSQVMFWGGLNKVIVLGLVGLGVVLDGLMGMQEPYIRTAIIWFYIGREGLSVVENLGKLGNNPPAFLVKFLEQLKDKGDQGGTAV